MRSIHRSIASVQARLLCQRAVTAWAHALLAAGAAALLLLLVDRLAGASAALGWPVAAWGGAALGLAALVAAPAWALWRRSDRATVARLIDDRLGLKDALASALHCATLPEDPPDLFARQVVCDGETVAATWPLAAGFPVRLGRAWAWVPVVAALLAGAAWWLPAGDLLGLRQRQQARVRQLADGERARQDLASAIAAVRQVDQRHAAGKPGSSGGFDSPGTPTTQPTDATPGLAELTALAQRDLSDPAVRRAAAAKLAAVQDHLAQAADQREREFQSLQDALTRLDPRTTGPADRFADALRRGDFPAAQQALDDVAHSAATLSPAQQQALREQLRSLSEQVREVSDGLPQRERPPRDGAGAGREAARQLAEGLERLSRGQTPERPPLERMARMQRDVERVRQSQALVEQALERLCQNDGGANPGSTGAAQRGARTASTTAAPGGTPGMPADPSRGSPGSGEPPGATPDDARDLTRYQLHRAGDSATDPGAGRAPVIASWLAPRDSVPAAPAAAFSQAVTQARADADLAVHDDRVPRRYHQAIKAYFNQLPQSPGEITQAPAAP